MKQPAHAFLLMLVIITLAACHPSKKTTVKEMEHKEPAAVVKTLAQDPGKYQDKFEKGVDFFANGNEPFWSLEIDFDKYMHFKTLNGIDITTPAVKGEKAMDAPVTRYAASTEKGMLIIQVAKQECINDMSGEKFPYKVTVDVKLNSEVDYTTYKGCGQNLADYKLYDIWVLDSMNHKKVLAADYSRGLPRLEFNLTQNTVMGFAGCNEMSGNIEIMGKAIRFSRIITTKKVCDGIKEDAYLQQLTNKTVRYSIDKLKLFLQTDDGSTLIYKKVD